MPFLLWRTSRSVQSAVLSRHGSQRFQAVVSVLQRQSAASSVEVCELYMHVFRILFLAGICSVNCLLTTSFFYLFFTVFSFCLVWYGTAFILSLWPVGMSPIYTPQDEDLSNIIHRPEEALDIQSAWCTYPRNETLVHQQFSLHQLHHGHPSQQLPKRFSCLRVSRVQYIHI